MMSAGKARGLGAGMDRLQTMQVFTRVVELRSFVGAADSLQLPRATVTHAVKELEARLGVRLLHRTTRQVRATLDGEAYYARCTRLLADFEEAESVFRAGALNPTGRLRVDLHATIAVHTIIPALPDFLARYPGIALELGTGDRSVDLVREGVDCVIRGGELQDSSLIARRLGSHEQATCASPAYLAAHGVPQTPADLAGHQAVNYLSPNTGRVWDMEFTVDGEVRSLPLPGRVAVNSTDTYVACCLSGFGLIQLPRYGVAHHLASGALCEVLADYRPPQMQISALYPQHRQLSPRVRVFLDWVASRFEAVY